MVFSEIILRIGLQLGKKYKTSIYFYHKYNTQIYLKLCGFRHTKQGVCVTWFKGSETKSLSNVSFNSNT